MVAHSLAPLLTHSPLGHQCSSAAASAPAPLVLPGDHLAAALLLRAKAEALRVHPRDAQGHLEEEHQAQSQSQSQAQAQGWGAAVPGALSSSQLRAAHVASSATRQLLRRRPGWSARHCSPAPHLHAALLRRGRQQPLPLPPRLGEVRLFSLPTPHTTGVPRSLGPPAASFNDSGASAAEEDIAEGVKDAGEGEEAEQGEDTEEQGVVEELAPRGETEFEIKPVPGDGRCLFSAVLFGYCHVTGLPLPSSYSQHCQMADMLRNKAADEFVKRREETEWFLEGEFESYVANMRRPHVWGGEPELLMLSHVLKHPITVFIRDTRDHQDGSVIIPIAEYGKEYGVVRGTKPGAEGPAGEESDSGSDSEEGFQEKATICVLYNGYNHYDSVQIGA